MPGLVPEPVQAQVRVQVQAPGPVQVPGQAQVPVPGQVQVQAQVPEPGLPLQVPGPELLQRGLPLPLPPCRPSSSSRAR